MPNDEAAAYEAWKAGLNGESFAVADRVEEMPIRFAVIYLAVQVAEMRRSRWRTTLAGLGAFIGGVAAGVFGHGARGIGG